MPAANAAASVSQSPTSCSACAGDFRCEACRFDDGLAGHPGPELFVRSALVCCEGCDSGLATHRYGDPTPALCINCCRRGVAS